MRKPKKKAPTEFLNYNEQDWLADFEYVKEYSNTDAIAKILLYRIDLVTTKSHKLYGESKPKDKKYLPPVELSVTLNLDEIKTEFKAIDGLYREGVGIFNFGLYLQDLESKDVQINKGDFVKYFDGQKDRFYEVTTVTNINSNNSIIGYKPTYILVGATMVTENVFFD